MAHFLILEPDSLLAGSLASFFTCGDNTAEAHSDPQTAVTAADRRRPDIVIAELQLAGRSGVEFLYEFRSYPDWQDVPLIIFTNLSAQQVDGYAEVLQDLNISAYFHKSEAALADLRQAAEALLPAYAKI